MPKIHQETLDGKLYDIGYKVVTEDMKSLGLRRNPNILTYPFDEWYFLPEDWVKEGKGDWGGMWLARTPGAARALKRYMLQRHSKETRIFKATIDQILYINNYRIKTNGVKLYKELFLD